MKKTITIFTVLLFLYPFSYVFAAKYIAEVAIIKGVVTQLPPGKYTASKLKVGSKIVKDTSIVTSNESFVRLKFVDNSFINLGANSKMVVLEITKQQEGLISLLKGQVRSKLSAETLKAKKGQALNKFLIKTRNASVGVRGTDFLTIHNTDSKITSLVVFRGKVAISRIESNLLLPNIDRKILGPLDKDDLHAILDSPTTKIVTKGKYSGVVPAFKNATVAIKVSPKQMEVLERNTTLDFSKANIKTLQRSIAQEKKKEIAIIEVEEGPPPQGYYDPVNDEFAPKAGGYIDIESAIYIQPQPDSELDKVNNVYKISKDYGDVDPITGSYIPPEGLKLDPKKGFVIKDLDQNQQLATAMNVFAIDKEKLSKREEEKLRESLSRVLIAKKAILNQDVKEDILDTPLDEDEYMFEMAKEFDQAKNYIKEVLNIDIALLLGNDSAVTEDFYYETIKTTNKSANYSNLAASISYNSYITTNWLIKPKLSADLLYYPSETERTVKEANKYQVAIDVDNLYNHGIGKTPAAVIFGVGVLKANKLEDDHNNYDSPYVNDNILRHDENSLYLRHLSITLGERIYFTDYDQGTLKLKVYNFDGFSSILNGRMQSVEIDYVKKIKPRYELTLGGAVDSRSTNISSGSLSHTRGWIKFNTYKLYESYSILTEINVIQTTYKDGARDQANGTELKITPSIELQKEFSSDLYSSIFYKYTKHSSNNINREFNKHDIGIKMNYRF